MQFLKAGDSYMIYDDSNNYKGIIELCGTEAYWMQLEYVTLSQAWECYEKLSELNQALRNNPEA